MIPQAVMCTIEGNIIYQIDLYGQKKEIGIIKSAYDELEKISNEYYEKLVELKVIVPPKSPEQIQQETINVMNQMMEQMKSMHAELEALKNGTRSTNAYADVEVKSSAGAAPDNGVGSSATVSCGSKQ